MMVRFCCMPHGTADRAREAPALESVIRHDVHLTHTSAWDRCGGNTTSCARRGWTASWRASTPSGVAQYPAARANLVWEHNVAEHVCSDPVALQLKL